MRAIRLIGVTGVLSAALMLAPKALAQGQWYGRVDLSYNSLPDNGWVSSGTTIQTTSKKGEGIDLALGRDLGRVWIGGGIRGEFEFKAKYNGVDSLSSGGQQFSGVTGHTRMVALMYNLYNDFMPESKFDPYLGVGFGYASVHFGNFYGYDSATTTGYALDASDSAFAYQAFAGFKLHLSSSLALDFAYNWFMLGNITLQSGTGNTGTTYHTSTATFGVDWNF